ncbi:MAG TPA: hypothetical protein VF152_04350 [Acidimicrobiia bacterium]
MVVFVFGVVVRATEELEVAELGLAAVGPADDVVDVAPFAGDVAAVCGAAPIAGDHGAAEGRRDDPGGAPDVEGLALGPGDDPGDVGVTRQAPRCRTADGLVEPRELGAGGPGAPLERVETDEHGQVRTHAAGPRGVTRSKDTPADLHKAVVAALGGGALVAAGAGLGERLDRGADDRPGLGVAGEVADHRALERLRDVQAAPVVTRGLVGLEAVAFDHVAPVLHHPPKPRCITLAGGFHHDRLGLPDRLRARRTRLHRPDDHPHVRVPDVAVGERRPRRRQRAGQATRHPHPLRRRPRRHPTAAPQPRPGRERTIGRTTTDSIETLEAPQPLRLEALPLTGKLHQIGAQCRYRDPVEVVARQLVDRRCQIPHPGPPRDDSGEARTCAPDPTARV